MFIFFQTPAPDNSLLLALIFLIEIKIGYSINIDKAYKDGDTWYLWYDGCVNWTPPKKHHGWWDTVGLARSKDLIHWEHYPRNPALPGLGIGPKQFDSTWIGWARMLIKDGIGYVYYTGPGLRTIEINKLTNWDSEGGETIDLLK